MLVSVILPAFNAEKTILKSIDSVLSQSYSNLELFVVLNGCTDDTEGVVKSVRDERIRILHSSKGIVPALNVGLRASTGELIARQDSDDIWHADKLKKQVDYLLENSNTDILGTQLRIVDGDENFIKNSNYPTENLQIINQILSGTNSIGHPSVIFRRKILDKCAGYFDLFPQAEDLDLWTRCIPWFKFANLNEELVTYRHIPNPNYNHNVPYTLSMWYRMIYGVKND